MRTFFIIEGLGVVAGIAALLFVSAHAGARLANVSVVDNQQLTEEAAQTLILHASAYARERDVELSAVIHCALAQVETGQCDLSALGAKQ